MSLDDYDASEALTAYYPNRDERRTARLWATEKLLHDMAALGVIDFFEGSGSDPTLLGGYSISKVWLRVDPGLTEQPGEIRAYSVGDATLLASWPLLDRAGFAAHLGTTIIQNAVDDAKAVGLEARGLAQMALVKIRKIDDVQIALKAQVFN